MYIQNDTFLYRLCIRAVSILYPLYMRSVWFVRGSCIERDRILDMRIEILELYYVKSTMYYVFEKGLKKCHMIWRRVSKS